MYNKSKRNSPLPLLPLRKLGPFLKRGQTSGWFYWYIAIKYPDQVQLLLKEQICMLVKQILPQRTQEQPRVTVSFGDVSVSLTWDEYFASLFFLFSHFLLQFCLYTNSVPYSKDLRFRVHLVLLFFMFYCLCFRFLFEDLKYLAFLIYELFLFVFEGVFFWCKEKVLHTKVWRLIIVFFGDS